MNLQMICKKLIKPLYFFNILYIMHETFLIVSMSYPCKCSKHSHRNHHRHHHDDISIVIIIIRYWDLRWLSLVQVYRRSPKFAQFWSIYFIFLYIHVYVSVVVKLIIPINSVHVFTKAETTIICWVREKMGFEIFP